MAKIQCYLIKDVNYDDSIFSNEDDVVLINMVRAYNIKSIKNRFELSQVWDTLTTAYNKSTNQNYTKKQLQKRTSNIEYKHKKHKSNEGLLSKPIEQNSEFSDAILQENSDSTDLVIDLEQQKLRVEIAKGTQFFLLSILHLKKENEICVLLGHIVFLNAVSFYPFYKGALCFLEV